MGRIIAGAVETGAAIDKFILYERVRQLYRIASGAMVATLVNSALLVALEWRIVGHRRLLAWLFAAISITVLRYLDIRRYRRATIAPEDTSHWLNRFRLGAGLMGLVWGCAPLWLFPDSSSLHQTFLAFVLGGMIAGAAGTYAIDLKSYLAFAVPTIVPLAARFLTTGQELPTVMGAMTLLFGGILTGTAIRVQASAIASFRYRYENDALIADLRVEQERTREANQALASHRDRLMELVAERTAELERDMAERRRAEDALRASQARFQRLVENANHAFFLQDSTGRFIDVNEQACRNLGYSRDELMQLRTPDISVHFDLAWVDTLVETLKHQPTITVEDAHIRKDGSRLPVELQISSVEDNGEVLWLSLARDTTERRRKEEELRHAKELAEEASRAKSDFLANMSHEIRTPMNGVLGMIDLLLQKKWPAEEMRYLEAARSAAGSLLRIINEILDFSRIEAGHLSVHSVEFDPRSVAENALETLAPVAEGKQLELVCDLDPDIPTRLLGDPDILRQVLTNLVGNAVKFTEKGEVVVTGRIEAAVAEGASAWLSLSVRDTGIGIAAESLGCVFDAFQQIDSSLTRKHGGTGLGLAICKRMLERMGGEIKVQSRQGQGSTFTVTVPVQVSPESSEPTATLKQVECLVVDDNASSRNALARLLRHLGARVEMASTGIEVVWMIQEEKIWNGAVRIALIDSSLPDGDAFAFAVEMMRAVPVSARILTMTAAHHLRGDLARSAAIGLAGCLAKPVRRAELIRAVQTAVEEASAAVVAPGENTAPGEDERPQPEPLGQEIYRTMLIAEDDPLSKLFVSTILEQEGWSVTTVNTGVEAVAAVRSGHFDLILMDVQMPEMDGLEATRTIRALERQRGQRSPILGLTAHALERDRERCLEAGMDGHIAKPVEIEQLLDAVTRALPAQGMPPPGTAASADLSAGD